MEAGNHETRNSIWKAGKQETAQNLKDAQEVHVRFSKDVAVFFLERPWHKKQITEANADGTVDVKLTVSLSPEWNGVT